MGIYYGGDIEGKLTGYEPFFDCDETGLFGEETTQELQYSGCHCLYEEDYEYPDYCEDCYESKEEHLADIDGDDTIRVGPTITFCYNKSHITTIEDEVEYTFNMLVSKYDVDFDKLEFNIDGKDYDFNKEYFFGLTSSHEAYRLIYTYCIGKQILNRLYNHNECHIWVDLE
jgi:hypothetical protein